MYFIFKMIITFPSSHSSHFPPSYVYFSFAPSQIHNHIYIFYKYNEFSPYNVICMSIISVRDDHLAFNNQVGGSSNIISSTLSILQEPTILCLELRPHRFFPSHVSVSLMFIVIQGLLRWPCWWDVIAVASLIVIGAPNLTNVCSSAY